MQSVLEYMGKMDELIEKEAVLEEVKSKEPKRERKGRPTGNSAPLNPEPAPTELPLRADLANVLLLQAQGLGFACSDIGIEYQYLLR